MPLPPDFLELARNAACPDDPEQTALETYCYALCHAYDDLERPVSNLSLILHIAAGLAPTNDDSARLDSAEQAERRRALAAYLRPIQLTLNELLIQAYNTAKMYYGGDGERPEVYQLTQSKWPPAEGLRDIYVTPNSTATVKPTNEFFNADYKPRRGRPAGSTKSVSGTDAYFACYNPAGMTSEHVSLTLNIGVKAVQKLRNASRRHCDTGDRIIMSRTNRQLLPIDPNTGRYYDEFTDETAWDQSRSPLYMYHAWAWGRQMYAKRISENGTNPNARCPFTNISARRLLDEDLEDVSDLGRHLPYYTAPAKPAVLRQYIGGWRLAILDLLWYDPRPLERRAAYRSKGTDAFALTINQAWEGIQSRWEHSNGGPSTRPLEEIGLLPVNHQRREVVDAADPYGPTPEIGSNKPVRFFPAIQHLKSRTAKLILPVPRTEARFAPGPAHLVIPKWTHYITPRSGAAPEARDYTTLADLANMIVDEVCTIAETGGVALAYYLFREAEQYAHGKLSQPIDDEYYTGTKMRVVAPELPVSDVPWDDGEAVRAKFMARMDLNNGVKVITPLIAPPEPAEPLDDDAIARDEQWDMIEKIGEKLIAGTMTERTYKHMWAGMEANAVDERERGWIHSAFESSYLQWRAENEIGAI